LYPSGNGDAFSRHHHAMQDDLRFEPALIFRPEQLDFPSDARSRDLLWIYKQRLGWAGARHD